MSEDNILAAVLAGGKSRRFGTDKSQYFLEGKKLIDYTLEKLSKKFKKIIIVSNDISHSDHTTIKDCIEGQQGPLVGALSAMKWANDSKFNIKWVATFPCDTPFFNTSIIEKFKEASKKKESKIYFAKDKYKLHNIFGLWSLSLIKKLENDLVKKSIRKVEYWGKKNGVKTIDFENEKYDTFFYINTKKNFEKL